MDERSTADNKGVVAIIAGEASGDRYGAVLASALINRAPHLSIIGIGGKQMRQAGVGLIDDSSSWGVMSFVEAAVVFFRVYPALLRLKRRLAEIKPDLLVLIDFGAFNIPLCKWAKEQGIKTMYYIPPGSWRKEKQGADLPAITDYIATPFPWSEEILKKMGANVEWVGHPLLDIVKPSKSEDELRDEFGLSPNDIVLGLLPGSREHEIAHHMPVMAKAAKMLKKLNPNAVFMAGLSANVSENMVNDIWGSYTDLPLKIISNRTYDVMKISKAIIMSSGTATLEAAIIGTPITVIYRGSFWMNLEFKIRKPKFDFISLPNIIAGRKLVTELLQEQASAHRIVSDVNLLLRDSPERASMLKGFAEVREKLGKPGATQFTADKILEMIGNADTISEKDFL